jgi:hypothetical protein
LLEGFAFKKPITLTLTYSDTLISGFIEDSLLVNFWNEIDGEWQDAATTCTPPSLYQRFLAENRLVLPICHLSHFVLFSKTHQIYLPAILCNN